MDLDFSKLDGATKYPSIETYHTLDPADGTLTDEVTTFEGPVVLREKVDGANGRIIVCPDGDWFIGSRTELLTARGDRVENQSLHMVAVLRDIAEKFAEFPVGGALCVHYLEVYGKGVSSGWKQYTAEAEYGCRMFDSAVVPLDILDLDSDKIASWREHGGQYFMNDQGLAPMAAAAGVATVPYLDKVDASQLPVGIAETLEFLNTFVPKSFARLGNSGLGNSGLGKAEGIVLRTEDRSIIRKAKFRDYERTLRMRAMKPGKTV